MRATTRTRSGPVRAGAGGGCTGRLRRSSSLLLQRRNWTRSRGPVNPYGNPTTPITASNPFGYAGQHTDHTSGLIYMRARWYDPATGQFMTSDPIGHASGETHLYGYAGGDPANVTDPTGLDYRDKVWGWLNSKADEAIAFYAKITVDECASKLTRGFAWLGGILSSLGTSDNLDASLAVVGGRAGSSRPRIRVGRNGKISSPDFPPVGPTRNEIGDAQQRLDDARLADKATHQKPTRTPREKRTLVDGAHDLLDALNDLEF